MSIDPLLEAFFEEAAELLADSEMALIELEKHPDDRELLNRIFRCAHTLKGNSAMLGFQEVTRYTHALEDLLELLRTGFRTVTARVISVLLASRDVLQRLLNQARSGSGASIEDTREVLASLGAIHDLVRAEPEPEPEPEPGPAVEATPADAPFLLDSEASVEPEITPEAKANEPSAAAPRRRSSDREEATSIRVPIDRVDRLINLVGELVIAQSIVSQAVSGFRPEKLAQLTEAVAQVDRHARELHERMMSIRMVPLKHLFGRLARLVRDLAAIVGKPAALEIIGEDTELDKVVIEKISDPLTHLLRNAADHGLEDPEVRRSAGKPSEGRLRLAAHQQGGSVYIDVSDDGQGLDMQRILAVAVERGLVSPDHLPPEEETLGLIFRPGFSTAEQVTEISGRGVGLDVVKKNLEALGGSITVRSERGQGTRFQIKLPLTVAVLEGQAVQVGDQVYLLPLLSILESIRPAPGSLHTIAGDGELVMVRGRSRPLIRLHRLFGVKPRVTEPTQGLLVIVEHEDRFAALLVDDVLGQQQVVIKSLEANYAKVEGIAGATILGDGQVALILDVAELIHLARNGAGAGIDLPAWKYGYPREQPLCRYREASRPH